MMYAHPPASIRSRHLGDVRRRRRRGPRLGQEATQRRLIGGGSASLESAAARAAGNKAELDGTNPPSPSLLTIL